MRLVLDRTGMSYREAPALAARCAGWWWLAAVAAAWLWARSLVPCLIVFGVGASFLASAWYRCWLAFAWLEVQ